MLISCDHEWNAPQWPGSLIHVLLPINGADAAQVARLRTTGTVFEFTRTCRSLTLLRAVLTRLERHRQFTADSFLFARDAVPETDLAALAGQVTADPWLIDITFDEETDDISRLVLGAHVTQNALFIHFFRNLQNTEAQDPVLVMQALQKYLGEPENEGGAEQ